ncbi:hypothetical protein PG994_013989 [Apiospora phragmitis]|uniref:F-box domain-containing protein n=1 Tax=Apiospora phragmitis TaxID=2905665 RepID=A0ABR1T317_9PEZI
MHILDLPNELIQSILISSIHVRGVKRGLRLNLVCKRFHENVVPALYVSRALDRFSAPHVGGFWWMRDDRYGAGELWHDYLVYRVMGETDPDVGRYVEIREAAEALWARTSSSSSSSSSSGSYSVGGGDGHNHRTLRDIVDGLCWLALERGTNSPGDRENWANHPQGLRAGNHTNAAFNLLCAAAYYNEVSVAAILLEKGDSTPVYEMNLFPQPVEIAAFRGHAEMLDLFQNHIWAVEKAAGYHRMPDDLDEDWIMWSVSRWPGAIQGALLADDLPMLQRAIFPPTLSDYPPPMLSKRFVFQDTAGPVWMCATDLSMLQWFAQSPAMWDYMTQLGAEPNRDLDRTKNWYAQHGNLAMLRHYCVRFAELGGLPREGKTPWLDINYTMAQQRGSPLLYACQNGYEDVVDYLLEEEYGGVAGSSQPGGQGGVAARAGSVRIMAKLLEYEFVSVSRGAKWLLREAVLGENRPMVELLVRKGFLFTEEHRRSTIEKASELGLDSMVDYLESWETTVSTV